MGDFLPIINMSSDFIVKAIDPGNFHRCALSVSGFAKCFGDGGGLGYPASQSVGGTTGSMGNALPYLDLGTGFNITALSFGGDTFHHCAFDQDQAVKCWGI